jgi:hypothetical protein
MVKPMRTKSATGAPKFLSASSHDLNPLATLSKNPDLVFASGLLLQLCSWRNFEATRPATYFNDLGSQRRY